MNQIFFKITHRIINAIYPFLVLYLVFFTLFLIPIIFSETKIHLDILLLLYGIPLIVFVLIKLFKRSSNMDTTYHAKLRQKDPS